MSANVIVSVLKDLRVFQKRCLHKREIEAWTAEFRNVQIPKEYKKNIDEYWGRFGVKVSGEWHRFYYALTGKEDPRFVDNGVYYSSIIYKLNRFDLNNAYDDKNSYQFLFGDRIKMPRTLLRNMNGHLCDESYDDITLSQAKKILYNTQKCIIKPTLDSSSGGGKGIVVLKNNGDKKYEEAVNKVLKRKDIIVQSFIKQNGIYAKFNPSSVNTVRVFSFLWNNEVHILTNYFRVGNDRKDFVECHTYIFNIENDGTLTTTINDHDFKRKIVTNHKYKVLTDEIKLPGIDAMVDIVKREHRRLKYFALIGWDFAFDIDDNPVLLEINTHWPAIDHIQMLNGPAFGELTDEVMKYVFSDKNDLKNSVYLGI